MSRQGGVTRPELSRQPWELLVPLIAIGVMAIILFSHRQPPSFGDYPEWTYQGLLLRDWMRGHPDSAYLLKNYPVPNSLTTLGLGVLMLIVPWSVASKLWLFIEAALGIWCARRLQRAAGNNQSWPLIVLTAAAVLGINVWYGFINFQFGTYFAMLFSAFLLEGRQSRWLYGAMLVLLFFSHMIPFGFALCLLFSYVQQNRRWKMLWQSVPSLLLTLWYFLGRLTHANVDSNAGMQISVRYGSMAFLAFRINTCLKCWGFVNAVAGFYDSVLLKLIGERWFVFFFVLNAALALPAFAIAAGAARRSIAGRDSARFLWLTIVLFAGIGFFMPGTIAGISDPGARMLQLSIWTAVCVLVVSQRWLERLLSGFAVGLMALSLYQMIFIAERPPQKGVTRTTLPRWMVEFDHVEYSAHTSYYDRIDEGKRDAPIFPTAMFIEKPEP